MRSIIITYIWRKQYTKEREQPNEQVTENHRRINEEATAPAEETVQTPSPDEFTKDQEESLGRLYLYLLQLRKERERRRINE